MNFIERFVKNCEIAGDHISIVDNDGRRETTYGELLSISKKIAKKLVSLGIKKNDNVIIALPKCMEYMASIYAIIFAKGCYVPLSDSFPKERKNQIIDQTEAKYIIDDDFLRDIDSYGLLDDISFDIDQNTCILYTSGTTNTPKGVLHDFHSVDLTIEKLLYIANNFEHKTQIYISPFYFVTHAFTLLQLSFDEPATLHLISEDKSSDLAYLISYLDRHNIDFLFTLPKMIKYLQGAKNLKTVLAGGEKVVNMYSDRFKIISIYAQTEGILFSHKIDKISDEAIVGKPAIKSTYKILDDNGKEVKKGEIGEICGIGRFAKCYYKDDELTKKTFFDLPSGDTLCHTNDFGYVNEDDNLVYVARKDDMIKIAGKRVEPSEIENAIKASDDIDECVVKNIEVNNVSLLCAFYTTNNKVYISPNRIIRNICKKLPLYMMPDRFIYIEKFPLSDTGKIAKHLLTVNDSIYKNIKTEPGKSELERVIINAFSKVLGGIASVGRNDDFFLLGGTSILAMELASVLEPYNINLNDIYSRRTPQAIATYCKKCDENELDNKNELELKKAQPLHDEFTKIYINQYISRPTDINLSNLIYVVEIKKDYMDVDKLSLCAYEIFKAHPSIGSVFIRDEACGYKLRYMEELIPHVEIVEKKESEFSDYVFSLLTAENIIGVPIFNSKIIRTEKADYFIMVHSHSLIDIYSFSLLFRQIIEYYYTKKMPAKDYYYLYINEIHDNKCIDVNNSIISEYNMQLDDEEYIGAPRLDKNIDQLPFETISVSSDTGETQLAMELYAKNMRVSLSTIYVAALLKTISEYNNVSKVKTSYIYHARDTKYKSNMVGSIANLVVLFADFEMLKSNEELLLTIEKQNHNNFAMFDMISKRSFVANTVIFNYFNTTNSLDDIESGNFVIRHDVLAKQINSDISNILFLILEPVNKSDNVYTHILTSNNYYKKESIDRFTTIYNKNLHDILSI